MLACELGADGDRVHLLAAAARASSSRSGAARSSRRCRRSSTAVGVFVDQPPDDVAAVASTCACSTRCSCTATRIRPRYARRRRRRDQGGRRVATDFDAARAAGALPATVTVLLDAHDPIRRGGTGRTIDWTRRRRASRALRPVILSGGLTPRTSREAHAPRAAVRRRRVVGRRVGARHEGSGEAARRSSPRWLDRRHDRPDDDHERDSTDASPSFAQRDPDARGYYGAYGGRFVPETLVAPVEELEAAYFDARAATTRSVERARARCCATTSAGRRRSTKRGGCARRSAARASSSSARTSRTPARTRSTTRSARRCSPQRMGKRRIIAETGAGQHGVATATVCALLGLECDVYMGAEDMERQALNVFRMRAARRRGDDASTPAAAR